MRMLLHALLIAPVTKSLGSSSSLWCSMLGHHFGVVMGSQMEKFDNLNVCGSFGVLSCVST